MTRPRGKGPGSNAKAWMSEQSWCSRGRAGPVHLGQEFVLYLESKGKPLKLSRVSSSHWLSDNAWGCSAQHPSRWATTSTEGSCLSNSCMTNHCFPKPPRTARAETRCAHLTYEETKAHGRGGREVSQRSRWVSASSGKGSAIGRTS